MSRYGAVRLVVRSASGYDPKACTALHNWVNAWNAANRKSEHLLYIIIVNNNLEAVTCFDTEEEAALFKLTCL